MPFADHLDNPEAPVQLSDGSWLVTEMGLDRGCVTWINPDGGERRTVLQTGRPNGLAVDSEGVLWIAETVRRPALLKATLDGACETVMTGCADRPFYFPNDLAIGPDGALYLTDSGVRYEDLMTGNTINPDVSKLTVDGSVYRIDTVTRTGTRLDSGLDFANGIAFGLDGHLYVTESRTGWVHRYQLESGAVVGREAFCNVLDPGRPIGFGGPDGIAFGQDGRLYVAVYGQGHIAVVNDDGAVERRLDTRGLKPTNVAFGAIGERALYVTEDESGTLDTIAVETDGLTLHTELRPVSGRV